MTSQPVLFEPNEPEKVSPTREKPVQVSPEKGISDLVGVFTDPIIVFPGGWGDTIPDWLRTTITMERLVMNVMALRGEEPTGTDAEACAYLMTVSLTQPMDDDWSRIYLYIATQTHQKHGKGDMPTDIAVNSLSDYEMAELRRFKRWLYQARVKARQERERARQREDKESAATRKEAEQPALFEF